MSQTHPEQDLTTLNEPLTQFQRKPTFIKKNNRGISGNIKLLKSDVVDDELTGFPVVVREFVNTIPEKNIANINLTQESIEFIDAI